MIRFSMLMLGLLVLGSAFAPTLPADETVVASATGRINHAGFRNRSHCTGFVVTGGHVVTAAHCMPGWDREQVHFLRGYDRGDLVQHVSAPRAAWRTVHGRDIAILCNAVPDAPAFALGDGPVAPGDRLLVPGYAIPREHMLQHHECQAWKVEDGGAIRVACPVRPGTSGAPVLQPVAEGFRVVGVMSSSSRTAARADGLDAAMLAPCAAP
ncbi:MAG: serine protease [Minwuia sp.]|nr:serine protease [Minwuia sp.]